MAIYVWNILLSLIRDAGASRSFDHLNIDAKRDAIRELAGSLFNKEELNVSQGKMPVALQALWQKNSSGQYVPLARLNTSKSDDVLRALVGALSADQFHGLSADVRRNIQAGARGSKYCLLKSVFF